MNWKTILNNKEYFDYVIYTDGSTPIQGMTWGYGIVVLVDGEIVKQFNGGGDHGTNNYAELTAAIEALKIIPEGSKVQIISDSEYLVKAFNLKWINAWKKKNWKRSGGVLKNKELWQELWNLTLNRNVKFEWVKGHNGNKYNELADQLAGEFVEKFNNG